MSNKEQVYREISDYLDKADNLTDNDKRKYLMALFEKHFEFEKLDHLLNYHDFHDIISNAKSNYNNIKLEISGRQLYPSEVPQVAIIEAVAMHLNGKGLLRKIVKIDYRGRK
jgi:hypothetical protein